METEIDIPNYLYNKPDGYYADDIIKNRDETIDGLKKDAESFIPRLEFFSQFRPIKSEVYLFGTPNIIEGEIKYIPKKFSVVSHTGKVYKALDCDVVIKNMTLFPKDEESEKDRGDKVDEWKNLLQHNEHKDSFTNLFQKQLKNGSGKWDNEFKKIANLIGMEDYSLRLNDIIFEYDE